MALLSIIVPVFNEAGTIMLILQKIHQIPVEHEIIVVDDFSSDGTAQLLKSARIEGLRVFFHEKNKGKGRAFLTGLRNARGEYVVIQDADLEYEPKELPSLLRPLQEGKSDIVLGNRFVKGYHGLLAHKIGNKFLTAFFNFLFSANLSDAETCYKMARRTTFQELALESADFNIEIEILAKALRLDKRVSEVPVGYHPRGYDEGKKIRWSDGLKAIRAILYYRFSTMEKN